MVRSSLRWRHDRETERARRSHHFERNVIIRPAPNANIGFRILKPQASDCDLIEERRKPRTTQANFHPTSIEFQTKGGGQQRKRNRACPGLRRTRNGIQNGAAIPLPLKPAKKLGQPRDTLTCAAS